MNLKSLINKSWYSTIGYIENQKSIEILGSYILHNKPVLDEYHGHIFAFTYKMPCYDILKNVIHSLLPNAKIILLDENRGHNFGTADLDNTVFDYCKENNIKWLCKTSFDVLLQPEVLDIPIQEADFYYMNGIGYGGMVKYNFNNKRIINEDFFPQTNFYFINISKTDYLNDKEYINKTYNTVQNTPDYNGKIWEYFQGWECEGFLRECVNRNNLSKYHLISPKVYIKLLEYIKQYQIHDCSHKNIMIEGVCHYQNIEQKITIL